MSPNHMPHTWVDVPIINVPRHNGTFVAVSEDALVHHTHPKYLVSFAFGFAIGVHSMDMDTWKKTCIHHCGIT